jgi:hypothetical protein
VSRPKWPIVRAHGVAVHSHFVPVARTMRASTDPDRDQALGMPPPDALRIVRAALACQRRACSRRGDTGAGRQVAVGGVASGHDEVPAAGRPAIIGEAKGRDRQARTALAPRAVKGRVAGSCTGPLQGCPRTTSSLTGWPVAIGWLDALPSAVPDRPICVSSQPADRSTWGRRIPNLVCSAAEPEVRSTQ